MNILFITSSSSLYGANRSLLALLEGINLSGFNPTVLVPKKGDFSDKLKEKGIDYEIVPIKKWMSQDSYKILPRLFVNLLILPILLWKIKSKDINLIYTNTSVTPVGAWVAYILKLPHIWHIREFGWEDYRLKYDFGRRQFEYWLNKSDHLIAVSESVNDKVLENIKAPKTVIYNGVIKKQDIKNLPISSFKKDINSITFGIIGLLSPAKGQKQAIRAFGRVHGQYKGVDLKIAGTGNEKYERELKKLCADLEIEKKVKFLGYVDNPFSDFYKNVDAVLVCSRNEAMGRVTAEAMAAGKLVIGLDSAGTSELIKHGQTGLLYKGTTNSLADKMMYVVTEDLSEITMKAQKEAIERFSIENYSKKVSKMISLVLD